MVPKRIMIIIIITTVIYNYRSAINEISDKSNKL